MSRGSGSAVLCYHAVSESWPDALAVPLAQVERQLPALLRARPAGTAADAVAGRRVLHVTFDDAFRNIAPALDLLERLRVPVTIFACSGYGDGRPLAVPELAGERYDAEALTTMTWDELRDLAARGFEIGSHTISHPHLPQLEAAEIERELAESRRRLEDELGRPCRFAAYPYGDHDERVRAAARRAGYDAAFGLPGVPGDRYALARIGVWREEPLWRLRLKVGLRTRLHAPAARAAP